MGEKEREDYIGYLLNASQLLKNRVTSTRWPYFMVIALMSRSSRPPHLRIYERVDRMTKKLCCDVEESAR